MKRRDRPSLSLPGFEEWNVAEVPADLGYWLSGLADGEGSFNIVFSKASVSVQCMFHIGLRADDEATIRLVQSIVGCGNIYQEKARPEPGRNNRPAVRIAFQSCEHAERIVAMFRRFPLRSKKARDFELWAQAVDVLVRAPAYGNRFTGKDPLKPLRNAELMSLKIKMEDGRRYKDHE